MALGIAAGVFWQGGAALAQSPTVSPAERWHATSPSAVGLNPTILTKLVAGIRSGEYSNIHGLLIVRHDQLAVEEYFEGPDQQRDVVAGSKPIGKVKFNSETLHDARSVTKSVVSILYGIARAQGVVPDLDTPALSAFPEYRDLRTPQRMKIQVRHLLSMTPGWSWDEDSHAYGDPLNSETAMDHAPDRYRYILTQPIVRPPGEKFDYDGGAVLLVAAIIERGTRMPLDRYAQKVLFGPLGITQYQWLHYPDGKAIAASGLRLRPRDMAKIGLLYLHKGTWHDKRIVPEDWVAESTKPHVPGDFYGYFWWLGRTSAGPEEIAVGYGGQRVLVSSGMDMVVVITAGLYDDRHQSETAGRILTQCTLAAGATVVN